MSPRKRQTKRQRHRLARKQKNTQVAKSGDSHAQQTGEIVATQTQYAGPLPSPEMLAKYEQIHPGTAERILVRFEKENEHRHAVELKIVDAQVAREREEPIQTKRGQWLGFTVALAGLLVAGAVGIWGDPRTASVIGGGTLVSLVTAFIFGRRTSKPEKQD